MIKKLFKLLIVTVIFFLLIIVYLIYFGVETSRFNTIIEDQIKSQNKDIDIKLTTVKLHLDLKNISIKIKTQNPELNIESKKKN